MRAFNKGNDASIFTNGSRAFVPISGRGETDYCQFGCQYRADVDEVAACHIRGIVDGLAFLVCEMVDRRSFNEYRGKPDQTLHN